MRDLEGITVVSLEQAVAAPYAAAKLADAGARVIKVERAEGDFARGYDELVLGGSSYFVWLNRGKQSVCLDLKDPRDHALMAAMLAEADVFIQNLAPGAVARLGFGRDALREKHPRLIMCSISGYGEDGPHRSQKAYDLLVQAECGLAGINGTPDGPARVGVSVCDIAAGLTAAHAITQALFARERTGVGRAIEVSLFHAVADWMNVPYLKTRYGGKPPKRQGLRHPSIAPYGAFTAGDGKALLLSIQNEREWAHFCAEVLGDAELAADPDYANNTARVAHRDALESRIEAVFARLDREGVIERLEKAGIAYGRLSSMDDLVAHPQNRIVSVVTEGGTVEMLAPGARMSGEVFSPGPVPTLGEHTDTVRAEFLPE